MERTQSFENDMGFALGWMVRFDDGAYGCEVQDMEGNMTRKRFDTLDETKSYLRQTWGFFNTDYAKFGKVA